MLTLKTNFLKYKDGNGNMQDSGMLFANNQTDITLTESGVAADAKVVGDELTQLSEEIANKAGLPYFVCDTAADTAAKTIDADGFELKEGMPILVKFTNANSASSPTLNIGGTGAKPLYRYGTTAMSTGTTTTGWVAGAVMLLVYDGDGDGWVRDYWNNTTYSNASLGNGYATCSTAEATTAKTASLSSYSLTTGGTVAVKFTNAVPANATLNVNSKGAKAVYFRGAKITAGVIKKGDIATFLYNGSYYHLIAIDRWQNDIEECSNGLANKIDINDFEGMKVHTDGLAYVFINGQPIGEGVAVMGGETGDVVGNVASDNTVLLKGDLREGTYYFQFETADGTVYDMCELTLNTTPDEPDEPVGPAYTNQIPISINADGTPFVGTNGEKGYKTNTRISLSGGGEKANTGSESTGFIPVTADSTIYIKDIEVLSTDTTHGAVGYDANFNKLGTSANGANIHAMFVTYGSGNVNGIYSCTLKNVSHFDSKDLAFIRLCSSEINANSILTVDQPITD